MATILDLLEAQMTEERCDQLALKVSGYISQHGGVLGKVVGGIVYGGLDAATPEYLFKALRELFHADETVAVDVGTSGVEAKP
jgi:thiamine pyrophosphate-dependent acetolactate synthase large subunit-like protein